MRKCSGTIQYSLIKALKSLGLGSWTEQRDYGMPRDFCLELEGTPMRISGVRMSLWGFRSVLGAPTIEHSTTHG